MSQIPYIVDGEFKGSIEVEANGCRHPGATSTGESCTQGCCDWYSCPVCGHLFLVECPD
jgi:hypothetical protein